MAGESKDSKNLQSQLAEKLNGVFEGVISERSHYYSKNQNKLPLPQDVNSIISKYANLNMGISGGIGLIPGPWGMAAAIPEIALVVRNQIIMIHDIGVACGKGKAMTKELLAGIFCWSLGSGGMSLLTLHGSKVLVKRTSLRVFQKIISMMAGRVTQKLLKSMISKWLPIVGAAAMATWSNYSTRQVGKKAIEIFNMDIEYTDDELSSPEDIETQMKFLANSENSNLQIVKLQALINLMKIDKNRTSEERMYINSLVEKAALADDQKAQLLNSYDSDEKFAIDYSLFSQAPDDAIGSLSDMVALAKRDGEFHVTEKMFIKHAGTQMGFSATDLEEMIAS